MEIKSLIEKIEYDYDDEEIAYIKSFLEALVSAGKSKNTIYSYFRDLKVFFDFKKSNSLLKKYKIEKLKPINITMYYSYLVADKQNSAASIKRKKYVLKLFLEYLFEMEIIEKIPIPKESVIKTKIKNNSRIPTYLEINEIQKINQSIRDLYADEFIRSRNFFIVNLFLHTGLRISELVSLDIKDMEKTKKTDYLTVIGKGNKERIIPINVEELSKELGDDDNLIKVYLDERKTIKSNTDALIIS